jgi:hypothetical protein
VCVAERVISERYQLLYARANHVFLVLLLSGRLRRYYQLCLGYFRYDVHFLGGGYYLVVYLLWRTLFRGLYGCGAGSHGVVGMRRHGVLVYCQ